MYAGGGGSGLRYDSHEVSTGRPFREEGRYKSIAECLRRSSDCKLHYRDSALNLVEDDYSAILSKVTSAMELYA